MKPNLIVRSVDHIETRIDPQDPYYARLIAWPPGPDRQTISCQIFLMNEDTLRQMAAMCIAAADDMQKINKKRQSKKTKFKKTDTTKS